MAAKGRAAGTAAGPSGRVPRNRLSRSRIVDAALALIDAEGVTAVTMPRVAERLGVGAMSLYRHVQSKDDLLDGVAEQVLSSVEVPGGDPDDWQGRVVGYLGIARCPPAAPGRLRSSLVCRYRPARPRLISESSCSPSAARCHGLARPVRVWAPSPHRVVTSIRKADLIAIGVRAAPPVDNVCELPRIVSAEHGDLIAVEAHELIAMFFGRPHTV